MELQPSTAPLPPFLAAVRRRHPDVDIVVLPADEPPSVGERGATDGADDAAVAAARERVDDAATGLNDLVGCSAPPAVLRHGPVRGSVRARTHCSLVREDGAEVLRRLERALTEQSWLVRRPPGDVHRLVARTDGLELRVSWAEPTGVLLLDLFSSPLQVGESRARNLVRR